MVLASLYVTVCAILYCFIALYSYMKISRKHKIESIDQKPGSHECDTLETWVERIASAKSKVAGL